MFKVSIMYPPTPSGRFDMSYYMGKHMPMVKGKIGDSCVGFTVESGLSGGAPGSSAPYTAIGVLSLSPESDVAPDLSNVQQALVALQEKGLVWKAARGVYALEDTSMGELVRQDY